MRLKGAKLIVAVVALSSMSFSLVAHAKPKPKPKVTQKGAKRTTIDFTDELIEGSVKKPELFYLMQKKDFNFKRLIKLRENFLPEMRRDADQLQPGGSGH